MLMVFGSIDPTAHKAFAFKARCLGTWPASLPFRVKVRDSNPQANIDFIDVHATGNPQEAADFARLINSEIDYLQRRPLREAPDSFWVVRKSTDLALHCRRLTELGQPLWSFELAIQTLTTLAELVRLNGLKEYVFKVKGVRDIAYERCEIFLKNPYGRTPQLAST
ncbi:MAG: hypothetical protein Q9221_005180 [Calogaya cf. arnoldii]